MAQLRRSTLCGLTMAVALLTPAAPAATGDAPPAPAAVCQVTTDKTALPTSVIVGAEVEITLHVEARCPAVTEPGKADVVLAIDRSASQRDNGTWEPTMRAASVFLDLMDFRRHQVGILTFSGGLWPLTPWTVLHQRLSSDEAAVKAALAAIDQPPPTTGGTNLTAAIADAQTELSSARHRADAQPVLVLLSDGGHNMPEALTGSPLQAAADAKAAGSLILTIGLGLDAAATAMLQQIASRPELHFPAPTAEDLEGALREIAGTVGGTGRLGSIQIIDYLTTEVTYVDGSAVPPPTTAQPGQLTWRLDDIPSGGWSARYRIRPLVAGTYATNKLAYVDYLDADGAVGTRDFPVPEITVREPGANAIYLPRTDRNYCKPARPFDVALVLDTSSSMWGEKLDRTREAAGEFLRYFAMPPSRVAVLAFNLQPSVVQDLTAERSAVRAALDRLPQAEGSRIDLAVLKAVEVLTAPGADPDRLAVIVLITDGRQVGGSVQAALDAGAAARLAGIVTFTIGFGPDADTDLLRRLAGAPERFYNAPTSADLLGIYRAIGGTLPCAYGR